MRTPPLFAALLAMPIMSCARHVVIDPELVPSRNDRDWTVHSEPAAPVDAGISPGGSYVVGGVRHVVEP